MYVGVMHSDENDVCSVTLPDYSGNRTYDLWSTYPMLCQLSWGVPKGGGDAEGCCTPMLCPSAQ